MKAGCTRHLVLRWSVTPVHCCVLISCGLGAVRMTGQLQGTPVLDAYPPLAPLQQKRLAARRHKTTYCYDFPSVFGNALREAWAARAAAGEPNAVPPPGNHNMGLLVSQAVPSSCSQRSLVDSHADLFPERAHPLLR